jgi:hypothetical protein
VPKHYPHIPDPATLVVNLMTVNLKLHFGLTNYEIKVPSVHNLTKMHVNMAKYEQQRKFLVMIRSQW